MIFVLFNRICFTVSQIRFANRYMYKKYIETRKKIRVMMLGCVMMLIKERIHYTVLPGA